MAEPNLHDEAVQAEQHLEALATGLAKAGAPEEAVNTVTKMAEVTRKIIKALGKGQEQTADDEPAAPPEEQPSGATPETMDSATASLHEEAQARARQSQGG